MRWEDVKALDKIYLNFGGGFDNNTDKKYRGYVSVDMEEENSFKKTKKDKNGCDWKAIHDLRKPIPLPSNSVDRILTEHFFEHLEEDDVSNIINQSYDILKKGGVMRIAVPDYNNLRDKKFLLRGGPHFEIDHLTLFTKSLIEELIAKSPFENYKLSQYWTDDGTFVDSPIDYSLGYVKRTPDHDPRNRMNIPVLNILVFLRNLTYKIKNNFKYDLYEYLSLIHNKYHVTTIVVDLIK
jgi:predicted SAM-dependent methyltransferase